MGILFGFLAALSNSFQNTFLKSSKSVDPFVVNFFRFVVAIPVLAVLVNGFSHWALPPLRFWILLLGLSLPIEIALSYFYVKAFQYSPQSLVGPLFSFSALFLIPLGFIVLGEVPSFIGFLGVVSMLAGPFFLGSGGNRIHFWVTLRELLREPGSWYMLVAAFLASLTVTLTKFSYQYAPPLLFAFYLVTALACAIGAYLFAWKRMPMRKTFKGSLFGSAIAYSAGTAFHFVGLSFLIATYFISIKRMSVVFDVLLGRIIHGEDHFRERLFGAVFMVAGLILIAFG